MPNPYGLDAHAQSIVARAARIATEVAAPNAASVDADAKFPRAAIDALQKGGFSGLTPRVAGGGRAAPPRTYAAVVEEFAAPSPPPEMVYVMTTAATAVIAASGRQGALVREIAAGRHLT